MMKPRFTALMALSILAAFSFSGKKPAMKPGPTDKCPVCGMFVGKYQDFLAEIIYQDGTPVFFDGAKDMFRYYLSPDRFHPARKVSDIDSVYVTDYYSLEMVDAHQARYVLGGDVYGPMGRELIPLAQEEDAKEFMKDHKGMSLLAFTEVTPAVLERLD